MGLVAVPTQSRLGERRVALVPEAVPRLIRAGLEVAVESGAGRHAYATDDAYRAAGATIKDDVLVDADAVLTVGPLPPESAHTLRSGAVLIGFLSPWSEPGLVRTLAERGVTAFAMELVPRISRAQSMDALSSQAMVAGYHGVLAAADRLPRFFPLS